MFKKLFILFLTLLANTPITECTKPQYSTVDLNTCCLFDTKFLKNHEAVRDHLIKAENFEEIKFKTSDNITIEGLFRKAKGPACSTFIVSCGFLPGRLEGMSSLIAILPQDSNILFYNARGHGKSEGFFQFLNFGNYGVHEYKDILAAISTAHEKDPNSPKILFGVCAGAFNCAHALNTMAEFEREKFIQRFNIKGLVFDSGWAQVSKVALSAIDSQIDRTLEKDTWMYSITNSVVSNYRSWFVLPQMKEYEKETCLFGKMKNIKLPVLYIHSKDDTFALFEDAKKLADETPNAITWWIDEKKSSHANHILKLKDEYKTKVQNFISYLLS
ncbi:TMEM53 family protein [Candidatus Dependentiae bacterium]|nr:TMEM53 family protein [Candidatus Dependentiae bacterium]